MLPFDLTKAVRGHKLITRDGSHKNITIFLPDDRDLTRDFPLIGTDNGEYRASYDLSGRYLIYTKDDLDLFLQEDSDLIEENEPVNASSQPTSWSRTSKMEGVLSLDNVGLDPHKSKEGKIKLCSEALHPELHYPLVDVAELSIEKGYKPFNWLEEGKASTHALYWLNAAQRHIDAVKMGIDINTKEKTLDNKPTKTQPYHAAQAAYCLLTLIYLSRQDVFIDDRMFKEGELKNDLL